jgi:hypothetical protein
MSTGPLLVVISIGIVDLLGCAGFAFFSHATWFVTFGSYPSLDRFFTTAGSALLSASELE